MLWAWVVVIHAHDGIDCSPPLSLCRRYSSCKLTSAFILALNFRVQRFGSIRIYDDSYACMHLIFLRSAFSCSFTTNGLVIIVRFHVIAFLFCWSECLFAFYFACLFNKIARDGFDLCMRSHLSDIRQNEMECNHMWCKCLISASGIVSTLPSLHFQMRRTNPKSTPQGLCRTSINASNTLIAYISTLIIRRL